MYVLRATTEGKLKCTFGIVCLKFTIKKTQKTDHEMSKIHLKINVDKFEAKKFSDDLELSNCLSI
jgi:hypothetical protein